MNRPSSIFIDADAVRFCRALRANGIAVTPAEAVTAVRTLDLIDLDDPQEAFLGLRGVLASRVEDFATFAKLFDEFWSGLIHAEQPRKNIEREPRPRMQRPFQSAAAEPKRLAFSVKNWAKSSKESEQLNVPSTSNVETRAEPDCSQFGADELQEIARMAKRIVRKLASKPSRRWEPVRRGSRVDLRRSLRKSLSTGGELAELSFKRRKRRKTRLVVICDVSGSMDLYGRLLLQFTHALQNSLARVETFVFSTSLERITGKLKDKAYERAIASLSGTRGWSGGTLIGPSLTAFNFGWRHLVDRRTIVIILSDGWDSGEPEELSAALAALKKRAARLIWLNPLLGSPTYQPLTRGIQAALPHIDVFAPLHNLESLRLLERHLV